MNNINIASWILHALSHRAKAMLWGIQEHGPLRLVIHASGITEADKSLSECSLILTYPDLFATRGKILHYLQCVKTCNIKIWENSPTNWYRILHTKGTVLINWSFRIWFVQFSIPFRLLNSEYLFHCTNLHDCPDGRTDLLWNKMGTPFARQVHIFFIQIPFLKLTWHPKMDDWNTSSVLRWPVFMCYVSFREGISFLLGFWFFGLTNSWLLTLTNFYWVWSGKLIHF